MPRTRRRPGTLQLVLLWWALSAPLLGILSLAEIVVEVPTFFARAESHPRSHVPVLNLALSHLFGGVAAGVTLSVLWSRMERRWTAAAAGFVSAIPFFLAIRIGILGPWTWSLQGILGLGVRSMFGVVVGLILWRMGRDTGVANMPPSRGEPCR